jgi:NADPH-dependent 2,4-dienoyl-CoA reductase/sulfur reductase-like enzyme/rhodanese-related sulfurtransferase
MNIVVIGASAAGLKAACRVRRLLPQARVIVLEAGEYISYSACGLPYFLSGDVDNFRQLTTTVYDVVKSPEFFAAVKDVTVLTGFQAERIDPERRVVATLNLKTGEEIEFGYDDLILATGAAPIVPPIPGNNLPGVCTFTRPEDALALRKALNDNQINRVAVVGAGFIGCELCEAFKALWGVETELFEAEAQVLPDLLGAGIARIVEMELVRQGIGLHLNACVSGIKPDDGKLKLTLSDGSSCAGFDRVVFATGVKPKTELAAAAGVKTGAKGAIVVDSRMRTSIPHIFAVGDCVQVIHELTGKSCHLPLGSLANRMGRIAGNVIAGEDDSLNPVCSAVCLKVFEMNVASVGMRAKAAAQAGFKPAIVWGTFTDKAHYYPEANWISAGMVYDVATLRVLGVQAAGRGDVIRRVDVASLLIRHKATLPQVRDFEPAYAPPYATPLDPLHYLAYAGIAAQCEDVTPFPPTELEKHANGSIVLDVREESEVKENPVTVECKRIIAIPLSEIRRRWSELPKNERIVVVCQRGARSAEATRILRENGFQDVRYMGGGLGFFQA